MGTKIGKNRIRFWINGQKEIILCLKSVKKEKVSVLKPSLGDSAATRTQNLLLRRQLLYPVELRNHSNSCFNWSG